MEYPLHVQTDRGQRVYRVYSWCFVHDEHLTFLLVKHKCVDSAKYSSHTYLVMVNRSIMLSMLLLIAPNIHCLLIVLSLL